MRLEPLCKLELAYTSDFTLVRPFGGEEGSGYGEVKGSIEGERLRGTFRGVNHPHRRSDKTMLPDAHGLIYTEDGAEILFSLDGRTVWIETPEGRQGRQLLRTLFETQDERYAWLNTAFCVLEGKISAASGRMEAQVFNCVSDLV